MTSGGPKEIPGEQLAAWKAAAEKAKLESQPPRPTSGQGGRVGWPDRRLPGARSAVCAVRDPRRADQGERHGHHGRGPVQRHGRAHPRLAQAGLEFPFLYVQKSSGGGTAWDLDDPVTKTRPVHCAAQAGARPGRRPLSRAAHQDPAAPENGDGHQHRSRQRVHP